MHAALSAAVNQVTTATQVGWSTFGPRARAGRRGRRTVLTFARHPGGFGADGSGGPAVTGRSTVAVMRAAGTGW